MLYDDWSYQSLNWACSKVCDILVYGQEPKVLYIFNVLETLGFDPKFGAYAVRSITEYYSVHHPALPCHHHFNVVTMNTQQYIKSKYDLSVYCNY